MAEKKHILPLIVIAQFCCTSLWFAANGVMSNLVSTFGLPKSALPNLTSAVQFGFITGTLVFAIFTLADRFRPTRLFLACAILGAIFNSVGIMGSNTYITLLTGRFAVGFFLAGIYPVGMKIASDHFSEGLGKSLGYLVGALVLGTALPHFLLFTGSAFPWRYVLVATSLLAVAGGLIILMVGEGPYRTAGGRPDLTAFFKVFRNRELRSAAFGYFGHMWELYAFWAFVPVMITIFNRLHPEIMISVPLWSFLVIGTGSLACVIAGYISQQAGPRRTAFTALLLSACCCLASPFAFSFGSEILFLIFLLFWGLVVIADSPMFSTLVAKSASPATRGTALTIVNGIGFAITILSIQLIDALRHVAGDQLVFVFLAAGPVFGLISMQKIRSQAPHRSSE